MDQNQLKEITVTAQRLYPGRDLSQLSAEEKKALFRAYESERAQAASLFNTEVPTGQNVGPSSIFVSASPWESVAAGIQKGAGAYQMGRINAAEAKGRQTSADLLANRDSRDRAYQTSVDDRAERERREWLATILGSRR